MLSEVVQKFNSEFFNRENDYEIISHWWEEQNWPVIPLETLPKTGLMIWLGTLPIAAGFLYQTDSSIAILEWIVANPKVSYEVRGKGLDVLLDDLSFVAHNFGFKKLFTMAKNERLIARAETHGFLKTDEGMTHLIREL